MVRTSDCGSDNKGSIPLQHILPLSFIGLGRYPVTVERRVRLSLRAFYVCARHRLKFTKQSSKYTNAFSVMSLSVHNYAVDDTVEVKER